jgi:hypothetical protein
MSFNSLQSTEKGHRQAKDCNRLKGPCIPSDDMRSVILHAVCKHRSDYSSDEVFKLLPRLVAGVVKRLCNFVRHGIYFLANDQAVP